MAGRGKRRYYGDEDEYGDEMMDFEANKEQRPLQIVRRKGVEGGGEAAAAGTVTASASLPDLSLTDSSQNNN